MTKKELSQLYYLNRETEMYQRKLQELEAAAVSCVSVITGMPHCPGVNEKVGRYQAEIHDLRELIRLNIQKCFIERMRIERYITTIDDSILRQVISYRYISCLDWRQVACCIGGGNSEKNLQMMLKNYLDKH